MVKLTNEDGSLDFLAIFDWIFAMIRDLAVLIFGGE